MNSTIPNSENPKPHGAGMHTHWLRGACIVSATALLLAPGLRAQTDAPKSAPAAKESTKQAVRQKFVPAPVDPSRGNGADFSILHHFEKDYPDVLMLMAHAGVGDSFPVQEEGKAQEFEVKVTAGDDDKLELEISWEKAANPKLFEGNKSPMKRTLPRDGTLTLPQIGEFKYVISYPSLTVASDGKDATDKAMLIVNRWPADNAYATTTEKGVQLFSMRFQTASVVRLQSTLQRAFPRDNVVVGASAEQVELPFFEIRNVRLSELARTIEFLSEGRLSVEVVEKDADMPGNVWRIAAKSSPAPAAAVKMRSVAAPHLFADEKKLDRVQRDAEEMEKMRLGIVENGRMGLQGVDPITQRVIETQVKRLTSQRVFVLIGSEDGVAGMEGFIKAAEQRAADDAAAKDALAAAIAPKMHAVAAPHLFANDARLKGFMKEAETMRKEWDDLARFLTKEAGSNADSTLRVGTFEPRSDQKVFVILGSDEAITGMESLIKSAEQLAADEDAKTAAREAATEKEALNKAADERTKAKKSEQ